MEAPTHLFKYRRVDDDLRHILVENTLWFSGVQDFNDPFDCAPDIFTEMDREMATRVLKGVVRNRLGNTTRANRRREERRLRKQHKSVQFGTPAGDAAVLRAYQVTIERAGILSLSSKDDDVLMWSHYADGHKGVCLVFDRSHVPFSMAHPVSYSAERPRINPLLEGAPDLEKAVLGKADYWAYEKEWRVILEKDQGAQEFDPRWLVGVILGAKIKPEQERMVREWVNEGQCRPAWYRTSFDPKKFRLLIRRESASPA